LKPYKEKTGAKQAALMKEPQKETHKRHYFFFGVFAATLDWKMVLWRIIWLYGDAP
jgi:hypothetical protein